jgi:hypothetical protein
MNNNPDRIVDFMLEQRLLRLLAQHPVLPYDTLQRRLAQVADGRAVRQALAGLVDRGLVSKRVERRALWFVGYSRQSTADQHLTLPDLPPAVEAWLSQLAW